MTKNGGGSGGGFLAVLLAWCVCKVAVLLALLYCGCNHSHHWTYPAQGGSAASRQSLETKLNT